MLKTEEIKVAIVMMMRAQCSGEESSAVATVISKLQNWFNANENAAKLADIAAKDEKKAKKEGPPRKKSKVK